jgi:hypothetical protein
MVPPTLHFPTKIAYEFFRSVMRHTSPAHCSFLDFSAIISPVSGDRYGK